jgi:hypothetical protein
LARAHYAAGRYELAASRYQQISRSSNEVTKMLNELSWSYLQARRYGDAVGVATQLQAGDLRNTFAPDAPMITAMALNELCQFPDSLRAVELFQQEYKPAFDWLSQWSKKKSELYPTAIAYLNKKMDRATIPSRVATEWLRSSAFITMQDEINRLYAEQELVKDFIPSVVAEQKEIAEEIREGAQDLKLVLKDESGMLKLYMPSEQKPEKRDVDDMKELQEKVASHNRLKLVSDSWQHTRANFETASAARQKYLVSRINEDLSRRTDKMFTELKDVAENSRMIKVEIYNGASHDIIFQNAHPDYKKIAKKFAQEMREREKEPASRVWDWGAIKTASAKIEVWEDELGAFKARLNDNCSNKNKYLALKKVAAR